MKTRNKTISLIVLTSLLVSPLIASADMESNNSVMQTSVNMNQDQMMSWALSPEQKTEFEAQKEKMGLIMKSLESDLKYIRENLTKENSEELKKKIEELKNSYIEKIAAVLDNKEEAEKIIEHRFQIFIKTQIENKERLKDMKEKIEKMKDKAKEFKEKALDKAKEMKAKMEEHKESKLVDKYKAKFIKQLKNKLDNIPSDKLEAIVTKIEAKRQIIADNTKLKAAIKEKYLAQLDALLEILKEKLNPSEEELDINQIINDATGTGWTIDNSWSTVTQ